MPNRFTVALDLAKRNHVTRILDTTTGEMSQPIKISVNQEGFETFDTTLGIFARPLQKVYFTDFCLSS